MVDGLRKPFRESMWFRLVKFECQMIDLDFDFNRRLVGCFHLFLLVVFQ